MKKLTLLGRVYSCNMKTLKKVLLILVSSPLLWIGTGVALISFLAYYLLWSGDHNPMARLADAFHVGLYVFPFLALIFVAGICLFINGIILGIVRLCRKLNEKTAAKAPEHPQ
jgi:hypothetical protein